VNSYWSLNRSLYAPLYSSQQLHTLWATDRSPFQGFTFGQFLYERGQYLDQGVYLASPSFGLSGTAGTFQNT